jgi:hypothetical protein
MKFGSKRASALALLLLAAACAPKQATDAAARPQAQPRPQSYPVAGLEAVIGRTARLLEAQFGKAELDIREGTARKLQFAGPVCILDAYLYPPQGEASRSSPMSTRGCATGGTSTGRAASRRSWRSGSGGRAKGQLPIHRRP